MLAHYSFSACPSLPTCLPITVFLHDPQHANIWCTLSRVCYGNSRAIDPKFPGLPGGQHLLYIIYTCTYLSYFCIRFVRLYFWLFLTLHVHCMLLHGNCVTGLSCESEVTEQGLLRQLQGHGPKASDYFCVLLWRSPGIQNASIWVLTQCRIVHCCLFSP